MSETKDQERRKAAQRFIKTLIELGTVKYEKGRPYRAIIYASKEGLANKVVEALEHMNAFIKLSK